MHKKLGIWLSIGGHIDPGEDPNQAALREVKEETGLEIRLWEGNKQLSVDEETFHNLIPPVGLNRHTTAHGHDHVTFVFLATTESDKISPEHPDTDFRWVSAEELKDMDLVLECTGACRSRPQNPGAPDIALSTGSLAPPFSRARMDL